MMYHVYQVVLRSKFPGTSVHRSVFVVEDNLLAAVARATGMYGLGWDLASAAECEDLPDHDSQARTLDRITAGTYAPPRVQDCTPELERATWLLMQTDDYKITGQGLSWAELIYVHNSPPHPVTRIEIRQSRSGDMT